MHRDGQLRESWKKHISDEFERHFTDYYNNLKDLQSSLEQTQHTNPKIHPKITVKKIQGKEIIVIEVKESSDHLVLAYGKPFIRVGKSTLKMSKDEYENKIIDKHKDKLQFDTQICKNALLKDVDANKLRWFLDRAKAMREFDVPSRVSVKEALERLDLIENGKLTNTAILLFGKRPQKFFVQSMIRCGRLKGTEGNDFIDMKVLEGTILDLRENAKKFMMTGLRYGIRANSRNRLNRKTLNENIGLFQETGFLLGSCF